MRLWSLHPSYLDAQGLVALWREGLLAQKVLMGKTKGYRNHPQLDRFKAQPDPLASIGSYLRHVQAEAVRRGYRFDAGKIVTDKRKVSLIDLEKGQLAFEAQHLLLKLKARDPARHALFRKVNGIEPHPLFRLVKGGIAPWERP